MFLKIPTYAKFPHILSLFSAACILYSSSAATAAITPSAGATLSWSPNPEPDVSEYKVYLGYQSGNYSTILNVSGTTSVTLPKEPLGTTLYIAVSAYNSAGLEGPLSAELVVVAAVPEPVAATSFAMASPGQGLIGWKYPKNASVGTGHFTVYASEDLVNWTSVSDISIDSPDSSDAEWLYFKFPYVANKRRMFFQVGASNGFGEIR